MSTTTTQPESTGDSRHPLLPRQNILPFVLVTALFFLWGIPNNLNDVLIRQFMKSFEITRFKAGLMQSAFYMGYFLLSMPAALVMRRFSYKFGLVTGLLLYSAGTLLFWPAAVVGEVRILPVRAVCHRQRSGFPGDRRQPVHRAVGRSCQFRAPLELLAGVQPAGRHHGRSGRHGLHLLGSRAQAQTGAGAQTRGAIPGIPPAGNHARHHALSGAGLRYRWRGRC
jgi:hypothetical protein